MCKMKKFSDLVIMNWWESAKISEIVSAASETMGFRNRGRKIIADRLIANRRLMVRIKRRILPLWLRNVFIPRTRRWNRIKTSVTRWPNRKPEIECTPWFKGQESKDIKGTKCSGKERKKSLSNENNSYMSQIPRSTFSKSRHNSCLILSMLWTLR